MPATVREFEAGLPDSAVLMYIENDLSIAQVNGVLFDHSPWVSWYLSSAKEKGGIDALFCFVVCGGFSLSKKLYLTINCMLGLPLDR